MVPVLGRHGQQPAVQGTRLGRPVQPAGVVGLAPGVGVRLGVVNEVPQDVIDAVAVTGQDAVPALVVNERVPGGNGADLDATRETQVAHVSYSSINRPPVDSRFFNARARLLAGFFLHTFLATGLHTFFFGFSHLSH